MTSGLRRLALLALGLDRPGRDLEILPDDTFIVSYPKSGNTWLRFLIGNLLSPQNPVNFGNLEDRIPDIYTARRRHLRRLARPRYLKSHEPFDPRYAKTVYAVRDPRDVVISYYRHQLKFGKLPDPFPLEEFGSMFVRGDIGPYGTWGDHVGSWLVARQKEDAFHLVRYENLRRDTAQEVSKLGSFLGLGDEHERVNVAIEASSIERMRALEQAQGDQWASTSKTRQDLPFIGKGDVGGWRQNLPASVSDAIEKAWASQMRELGYLE